MENNRREPTTEEILEQFVSQRSSTLEIRQAARAKHADLVRQCVVRRRELGWSVDDLAEKMSASPEIIVRFEANHSLNDLLWILILIAVLGGEVSLSFTELIPKN